MMYIPLSPVNVFGVLLYARRCGRQSVCGRELRCRRNVAERGIWVGEKRAESGRFSASRVLLRNGSGAPTLFLQAFWLSTTDLC